MSRSPLSATEAAAWAGYQRMRVRLAGKIGRELARTAGVSEADFEILIAIGQESGHAVRALALRCGLEWEKSRLSHQLRRMEQRGLVQREECTQDGRGSVVRLTDKGRRLAAEAKAVYEKSVSEHMMAVLTPAQVRALGEITEAVLAQIEAPEHSARGAATLPTAARPTAARPTAARPAAAS